MAGVIKPLTIKAAPLSTLFLVATAIFAQAPAPSPAAPAPGAAKGTTGVPLYRVTVVDRTVKAINYQYRSGPTMINFRGTVLLPYAKGEAMVEARQGRVDIDAKIEGLLPTQRFGPEYLTYVLWAITPEGRPHNIGELVSDTSNKAHLHVTTDLQAFALVVTAEPYSAVRMPSDVVVAENEVRPDTVGTIEQVNARFELLPRGQYTMQVAGNPVPEGPKLTMHQYEAATEVYQAQNALSIAASAGAERYAPEVYARAQQLFTTAQQIQARKGDYRQVVQNAREAAQTAEDARVIATQHRDLDQLGQANAELTKARTELATAQQDREAAITAARDAEAKLAAARAQTVAADNARTQAETDAAAALAREAAAVAPRPAVTSPPAPASTRAQEQAAENRYQGEVAGQRELRGRVLSEMKSALPTLDSGRGLIATVSDDSFHGSSVLDVPSSRVVSLGRALARHPGLMVRVEGYSAAADGEPLSLERASAVRRILISSGLPMNAVSADGLGDSRPLGSNATPQGRRANTRIEIVVTGNSIGNVPLWEQSNLTGSAPVLTGAAGRVE